MIEVQELSGGLTKVTLKGRIDFAGAQAVEAEMAKVADSRLLVVIDLAPVDFMASMGLRILITFAKSIHSRRGRVLLLADRGRGDHGRDTRLAAGCAR